MAGNSIHSHVAAALTVWGLCSVVPRVVLEPIRAHPSLTVAEDDDGPPLYAFPDAVDDEFVSAVEVFVCFLRLRVLIFVFSDFVFVMFK